jgi:hypothetical protein
MLPCVDVLRRGGFRCEECAFIAHISTTIVLTAPSNVCELLVPILSSGEPVEKQRDRLSTTIAPDSMRLITSQAANEGITLGGIIDEYVRASAPNVAAPMKCCVSAVRITSRSAPRCTMRLASAAAL